MGLETLKLPKVISHKSEALKRTDLFSPKSPVRSVLSPELSRVEGVPLTIEHKEKSDRKSYFYYMRKIAEIRKQAEEE